MFSYERTPDNIAHEFLGKAGGVKGDREPFLAQQILECADYHASIAILEGKQKELQEIAQYIATMYGSMSLKPDRDTKLHDQGWYKALQGLEQWIKREYEAIGVEKKAVEQHGNYGDRLRP